MSDSQYDPVESRLLSIEQKVNLLLVAAAIQVVTILISWINYIFGSLFGFIIFLVFLAAVGGLLYVMRNRLPELSGKFIRFVFSRPGEPSTSTSDDELT